MTVRISRPVLGLSAALLIAISPATADEPDSPALADSLLHSNVPLFGSSFGGKWPQPIADQVTGDFGCTSRVRFGEWTLKRRDREDAEWFRFSNYGVFHCWANVANARERDGLDGGEVRPSFFVYLGRKGRGERAVELWAVQMGARPGSDYLLLSRPPDQGVITSFSVLQRRCAPQAVRRMNDSLDILRTDYCSLNTQSDLIAFARKMAALPPLGTLTLAAEPSGGEALTAAPAGPKPRATP